MKIHIILKKNSKVPLYIQIYKAFRNSILEGSLKPGTKLESIIQLKQSLCVSRNTVEMAYLQLSVEGFIYSRRRSGYFVSDLNNYKSLDYSANHSEVIKDVASPIKSRCCNKTGAKYDFDPGSTDHNLFPFKKWNKIEQGIMSLENRGVLTYPDPRGEIQLRIEISKYLKHSRGVNCHPDQIIIGAGIQTLINLICFLLGGEEPLKVALEDPGYPAIRKAFEWNRCEIMPINLKNNVIDISEVINRPISPSVVYLTPSNQHPMGGLLNVSDKLSLLNWVKDNKSYLIEDDYDSEFRYNIHPVPTMFSLDNSDRVIYLGTFSKTLFPAMRMSYVVLPNKLTRKFNEIESYYNQTASKIHQLTLADFMKDGLFEQHIRKMRTLYGKKHKKMVEMIERVFKNNACIIGDHAGINFTLRIKLPYFESEIIKRAREAGIIIYPISLYQVNRKINSRYSDFILGYGHMTLEEIEDAINLLGEALL